LEQIYKIISFVINTVDDRYNLETCL